ncbi:MAG: RNA 2',3'-cyclic phosphodiesterase [Nitrospinae bacterium]|nr:RNA 2',3'-cyclic phosphodiesterase [Nitrospinota bacterium]MBI3815581.1 RNA 2',3'-cyclic phosphodiesterase [Nitrospinota bacterium]
MQTIRAFISIEIPQEVREKISLIQEQLKTVETPVSWVRPQSIHLTLKFLGNISEAQIQDIGNCISTAANGINPFTVNIRGTGVFPNLNYPRVIWLGLEDKTDSLFRLQKGIDGCLSKIGFEAEERGFTPHLTVGRIKSLRGKNQLIRTIHIYRDIEAGEIAVDKINLMRSQLNPAGAIYTVLEEIKLQ